MLIQVLKLYVFFILISRSYPLSIGLLAISIEVVSYKSLPANWESLYTTWIWLEVLVAL